VVEDGERGRSDETENKKKEKGVRDELATSCKGLSH